MSKFDNDAEFWTDEFLDYLKENEGNLDRESLVGWFKIAMLSAANRVSVKAPSIECSVIQDGILEPKSIIPVGIFCRAGEYYMEAYDLDRNEHKEFDLLDMNFVSGTDTEKLRILRLSVHEDVMDNAPPDWEVVSELVADGYMVETFSNEGSDDSIPLISYKITQKGLGYLRQNRTLDSALKSA